MDISFTVFVCFCVCLFVRLRISMAKIKRAASNFYRRFIGVQGRESHIHTFFVNFAPPEAQIGRIGQRARPRPPGCKHHCRNAPT